MGGSNQYFQTPEAGHEYPLGNQGNIGHAPVLPVRHPGTDGIICGHHVGSGNPITREPILKCPGENREAATHI